MLDCANGPQKEIQEKIDDEEDRWQESSEENKIPQEDCDEKDCGEGSCGKEGVRKDCSRAEDCEAGIEQEEFAEATAA